MQIIVTLINRMGFVKQMPWSEPLPPEIRIPVPPTRYRFPDDTTKYCRPLDLRFERQYYTTIYEEA